MKQSARILKQLERGPVNSVDFAAPACDGGTPILRVAARIHELQACGYRIRSERKLNGTSTYHLVRDVERSDDAHIAAERIAASPTAVASLDASELFDPTPFGRGDYRDHDRHADRLNELHRGEL